MLEKALYDLPGSSIVLVLMYSFQVKMYLHYIAIDFYIFCS